MISDSLCNLYFTATKYDQQKMRAINHSYSIISHFPSLSELAEFFLDPVQKSNQRISHFVVLTPGVKNSLKKRIINVCLMSVAQNFGTKFSVKRS